MQIGGWRCSGLPKSIASGPASGSYCTVRVAVPATPFRDAVIVAVPVATAVATPEEVMVATVVSLEVQDTDEVMLLPLLMLSWRMTVQPSGAVGTLVPEPS